MYNYSYSSCCFWRWASTSFSQASRTGCLGFAARKELITGSCSSLLSGEKAKKPLAAAAGSHSSSGRRQSIVESAQTPPWRASSMRRSRSLSAAGGIQKPPYFSRTFMATRMRSYAEEKSPRSPAMSRRSMARTVQPWL